MLSHRGLIFEREGIRWSCNSDQCSESYPKIGPVGTDDTSQPSPSAYSSFRAWLSGRDPASKDGRWPRTHERLDLLDLWYELVENYSQRDLTEHGDVLPALSGLASAAHRVQGSRYLAGLWEIDIQLGLLWRTNRHQGDFEDLSQPGMDSYYASEHILAPTSNADSVTNAVQEPTCEYGGVTTCKHQE